jgi:hypothetical protein
MKTRNEIPFEQRPLKGTLFLFFSQKEISNTKKVMILKIQVLTLKN